MRAPHHLTRRGVFHRLVAAVAAGPLALAGCAGTGGRAAAAPGVSSDRSRRTFREAVCFDSQGKTLFGMVHGPGPGDARRSPGVLILHGLVGSKDQPHRIFVNLAERLAAQRCVSLRFDLNGRGDSEGDSLDITPQADLADAHAGLDFLARRPDVDPARLAVVGMSWGGVLACQLASDPRLRKVALWSSVPTRSLEWRPRLRPVAGGLAADEYGNLIGEQFYKQLHTVRPLDALCEARKPVLLAFGTGDRDIARDAPAARDELQRAGVPVTVESIEGADHAFMSADWDRAAVEATARWLLPL
jgi:uncharacterized protein